jgi:sec-independent protein translocase protein TatB
MVHPPPIQLATLGWEDSLILMVLALVVFGPRRLPLIGRQIGKLMYEFRKASNDFKFQMEEELRASEEADRRKKEEAERLRVEALAAQSQASVSAPAQTIESVADVGAMETPTPPGYPETHAAEASSAKTEEGGDVVPTIQPPSTGQQVSATSRSAYDIQASEASAGTDVNPDADVNANAEEFVAAGTAGEVAPPAPEPASQEAKFASDNPSVNPSGTSAKETVTQHG